MNILRRLFSGSAYRAVSLDVPSHSRATDTLKQYDVYRRVQERGIMLIQERTVQVDRVESDSVESATLSAQRMYGTGAYVVLVMD